MGRASMDEGELRKEFFRVEATAVGVEVLVCRIDWDGPHTPVSTWVRGRRLPAGAGQREVDAAIASILDDPRCFGVCRECGERQPLGWMHDARICQSCAERNHGVVH